jgi:hypothetical protein
MGKIFINQDVLKIELTYDSLPSAVEHAWIKYRSPGSDEDKTFPTEATHNIASSSFSIVFAVGETLSDYGVSGTWKFWLWLELTDGRVIPGEVISEKIYEEGRGYAVV